MGGFLDALTRKQPKPRGFRYKPMYYNAEKADFEAYIAKLRKERDARERGEYRPDFKGAFTSRAKKKTPYQRQIAMYNIRLLVVLTGACILAYYLFSTGTIAKGLDQFLKVFSNRDGLY